MFTQSVSKVNCYRIYWILVKSICFLSQQLLKKYSVNIWKTWRHIGTEITNKSALYYYNVIFLFSILQHYLRSGEKASYYGEPCDKCGKYPRAPYRNYDNWSTNEILWIIWYQMLEVPKSPESELWQLTINDQPTPNKDKTYWRPKRWTRCPHRSWFDVETFPLWWFIEKQTVLLKRSSDVKREVCITF